MGTLFLTKEARIDNGAKTVSNKAQKQTYIAMEQVRESRE